MNTESLKHIDAHSHLNFDRFDDDRETIIAEMEEQGIGAINVGVDVQTSKESIDLAEEYDHIWSSVGCHPSEVSESFDVSKYQELIKDSGQVVALGECGLDYSRSEYRARKDRQEDAFTAQIKLAAEEKLPLILHIRPRENSMDAYEDGLDILRHFQKQSDVDLTGTAHFFVGNEEIAQQFLELGFSISFTGPLTYDTRLQEVCEYIPTNRLLAETDSPFASPQSTKQTRNTPLEVPKVVQAIAQAKNESVDTMAAQLTANTTRLFALPSVEKQVNL